MGEKTVVFYLAVIMIAVFREIVGERTIAVSSELG